MIPIYLEQSGKVHQESDIGVETENGDTERSEQITGEEQRGAMGGGCPGNGKRPRMGLAEKLNASRAQGIMGQKI